MSPQAPPEPIKGVNATHFYDYMNLPIHGPVPVIERDAPPHKNLVLNEHHQVAVFRLWIKEDFDDYSKLLTRISNDLDIIEERIEFVAEEQNWIVFVHYTDLFMSPARNAPIYNEPREFEEYGWRGNKTVVHR